MTEPKQVSSHTADINASAVGRYAMDDRDDFTDAGPGLLTELPEKMYSADGHLVRDGSLTAYIADDEAAPDTVNPALWRESQLLRRQGVFKVVDGLYQVRITMIVTIVDAPDGPRAHIPGCPVQSVRTPAPAPSAATPSAEALSLATSRPPKKSAHASAPVSASATNRHGPSTTPSVQSACSTVMTGPGWVIRRTCCVPSARNTGYVTSIGVASSSDVTTSVTSPGAAGSTGQSPRCAGGKRTAPDGSGTSPGWKDSAAGVGPGLGAALGAVHAVSARSVVSARAPIALLSSAIRMAVIVGGAGGATPGRSPGRVTSRRRERSRDSLVHIRHPGFRRP